MYLVKYYDDEWLIECKTFLSFDGAKKDIKAWRKQKSLSGYLFDIEVFKKQPDKTWKAVTDEFLYI